MSYQSTKQFLQCRASPLWHKASPIRRMIVRLSPEEVRHASRNADSAYLFCIARDGKKGTLSQHFVTHVVPPLHGLSLCRSHSGPVVLKWEWVYEGGCASWWAVGPGGSGVRAAIKLPGLRINSIEGGQQPNTELR